MAKPNKPQEHELILMAKSQVQKADKDLLADSTRLKVADRILAKRKATFDKKQKFFDQYEELKESDPKAAAALYEKRKLEVTLNNKTEKGVLVVALREQIRQKTEKMATLEAELHALTTYNPRKELQKRVESDKTGKLEEAVGELQPFKDPTRLRNDKSKKTMMLLVDKKDWVEPKPNGKFGVGSKESIPLECLAFDAKRVPLFVIEEFGLGAIPAHATPHQIFQAQLKALPGFIEILRQSIPLPYNVETTVYRKGPQGRLVSQKVIVANEDPRLYGVDGTGDNDGKLLYFRQMDDSPYLMVQTFEGSHEHVRKTVHADQNYNIEIPKVQTALQETQSIHEVLLKTTAKDLKDEKINHDFVLALWQTLLKFADRPLSTPIGQKFPWEGHIRNEKKRNAFRSLWASYSLKDRMGRLNPGVICARQITTLTNLMSRDSQIPRISGYGDLDQKVLKSNISKGKSILYGYQAPLSEIGEILSGLKDHPVFKDGQEIQGSQVKDLVGTLFKKPFQIQGLSKLSEVPPMRPYNLLGRKLKELLMKARNLIAETDPEARAKVGPDSKSDVNDDKHPNDTHELNGRQRYQRICELIQEARYVPQLLDSLVKVEEMIDKVSLAPDPNPLELMTMAEQWKNLLRNQGEQMGDSGTATNAVHAKLVEWCDTFIKELGLYTQERAKKPSPKEIQSLRIDLKDLLKSINFLAFLEQLD